MHQRNSFSAVLPALAAVLAFGGLSACSTAPDSAEIHKQFVEISATSFRTEGQADVARLLPDRDNEVCAEAAVAGKEISPAIAKEIEARNLKTIKAPADGVYLGKWQTGEKIAQSGRGKTWTDAEGSENGGNCYNCHQLDKAELSYGTLGPSLYNYGKLRGVTDPKSDAAKAVVEYTWGKLNNARAYNACSSMPRFAHKKILTEAQIQHVMALLLDPASPVNSR